ncbi:uncharacterized protein BO97DRAFT_442002 [Aspergillus homomorphus CBS 101889]|uniref:Uncharacterized protein n=1 Tax=Aspergillus homomorphus (strain CBS 101889) TaxID=1450537 RepID=A0A395I1N8_ASPHC|nr:hypothetical protein BO97DRAFT_442002 [Aspergillus homomorphus CBS 101889]RAL14102.1 hypothetical protein BO97DRAFT_442002 [Aspergillus homomorphus CBS 101889]
MIQFFLAFVGLWTAVVFIRKLVVSSPLQSSIKRSSCDRPGSQPVTREEDTLDICGPGLIKGEGYIDYRVLGSLGNISFVQAWPSNGRFWCKEGPTLADMIFLGLDSSEPMVPRSPSPTEEDAFVDRLRLVGAGEWENEYTCLEEWIGEAATTNLGRYRQSTYGWPSNGKGLWVWEYNSHRWRFTPRQRELVDALRGAQSMDEQCAILERSGQATFYEDPCDYPPIADLFKNRKEEL